FMSLVVLPRLDLFLLVYGHHRSLHSFPTRRSSDLRYHVQVCGTTPCLLRGSDDVMAACKNRGMVKGKTTPDGLFTLTEVECMGTCTNAPMVQINDDNYEDLDYDSTVRILDALAAGEQPKAGTQLANRHTSEPDGGPTTLKAMVSSNHDYRKEW